jgi:hypothetical protein
MVQSRKIVDSWKSLRPGPSLSKNGPARSSACNTGSDEIGRYWHLADNPAAAAFVRYWTKADKGGF